MQSLSPWAWQVGLRKGQHARCGGAGGGVPRRRAARQRSQSEQVQEGCEVGTRSGGAPVRGQSHRDREKSQKEQIFPKQVNEKIFLLKAEISPPTAKGTGRGSQAAHTPPGETRGPPRVRQESRHQSFQDGASQSLPGPEHPYLLLQIQITQQPTSLGSPPEAPKEGRSQLGMAQEKGDGTGPGLGRVRRSWSPRPQVVLGPSGVVAGRIDLSCGDLTGGTGQAAGKEKCVSSGQCPPPPQEGPRQLLLS